MNVEAVNLVEEEENVGVGVRTQGPVRSVRGEAGRLDSGTERGEPKD